MTTTDGSAPPAPALPGDPAQLQMQKAIVVAHRRGQRLYALRLAVVLVVGGVGVVVGLVGAADSVSVWAQAGGLAAALVPLGLSWLVGTWESGATDRAAALQHRYDTVAFGLPAGSFAPAPDPGEVEALARRWAGDEEVLRHWYRDTSPLPRSAGAMFCQRTNLRWDSHHRRVLAWVGLAAGTAGLALGAVIGGRVGWSVADWLIGWVGPTAGVTQLSIETWMRHRGLARDKARLADEATRLLAGDDGDRPDEDDCLMLQYELLALRRRAARVPRWLQRTYQRHEDDRTADDLAALRALPRYRGA